MNGNALIESTMLGIEGHGIMTCYLMLKQEGTGQGFGGYSLDGPYNHKTKEREHNKVCGYFIKRILETVGVEKWEDLEGKYIRVKGEEWGDIEAIGHITKNKWFYPKKEIEAMRDDNALSAA
jgi:hypothetical protein